jgi:penicillin-binding protein activator
MSTHRALIWLLSSALLGCATNDAQYRERGDVHFGYSARDLTKNTDDIVRRFLRTDPRADWGCDDERPAIALRPVVNRSTEHLDTRAITERIRTALIKQRRFVFTTERENLADTADEVDQQQDSGQYDPREAARRGRWLPPRYLLRGRFSSITKIDEDAGRSDVYYLLTITLDEVDTARTVWSAESEIAKVKTRATFGS